MIQKKLLRVCVLFFSAFALHVSAREIPSVDFQPNYIVVADVTMSTPNGNPAGMLKKGTLVSARPALEGVLNVTTADGRAGLIAVDACSRLRHSIEITDAVMSVAKSSNRFAIDLYQQIRHGEGNHFFSPVSVSTALAMAYSGSAGATQQEMAKVLHLSPKQEFRSGIGNLMEVLNSTGDRNGFQLSSANRLWGAVDARFDSRFLTMMKEQFHAPLELLDFRQTERARNTINAAIEKQTRGRIENLIAQGVLNPTDRLVLTNAIYFLGGWQSEFATSATKPSLFHITNEKSIETPMMYQQQSFAYMEDEATQVVSLPYRDARLSMVIILPKERDGLPALDDRFTLDRLDGWLSKLKSDRPVQLHLPKIKLQSQLKLADVLRSMGMKSAFRPDADFSAMSTSESLMISEVIHQAEVDVDEKGTEAAAATAVITALTSALIEPIEPLKPVVFLADHPFLFLIHDTESGAILFLGRVTEPSVDAQILR